MSGRARAVTKQAWLRLATFLLIIWCGNAIAANQDAEPTSRPLASPAITVAHARLGAMRLGKVCSALDAIKRQCDGKMTCNVRPDPKLCDADSPPPDNLMPQLEVTYRCTSTDKPRRQLATSPLRMQLSCAGLLR